jgi:hypothetical protein
MRILFFAQGTIILRCLWQFRGQAGKRQVADAKVGLAHVAGGEVAGLESGGVAVHILKR